MLPTSHFQPSFPASESGPLTEVAHPLMEEAARLAELLAINWRRGHCCLAEEILADHHDVLELPQAALRVVFEEVCQRQELGQEVSLNELNDRFPQWREQLAVLFDCIQMLGLAPRAPRFPALGETLGEFRILAELGRGGSGRVYLAEQTFLAGRFTILKLTPLVDREHLNLARLQHTHIVPLYSVRDFPDRNLRKLCMPCLGGATLHHLFRTLQPTAPETRTGNDLLLALRSSVADSRLYWHGPGPNRRFLERASYVQAICWIGVCLADALHYAHEQGLVHLDVKPSNVLLTADGQPMLLDFHLAREPIRSNGDDPEWLGGTPGYMAPEQQAVLRACRNKQPIPADVDARADVYALGLLLREGLYGELSEAEALRAGEHLPPRPDVSPGLRDVLAHCLRVNPAERYPSAAAVAEDLRRHLTDRPLLGVRNRSLTERWRKWRRRRPHAVVLAFLAALCLAGAAGYAVVNFQEGSQRRYDAQAALEEGRQQSEQHRYAEAVRSFDRGLERLGREGTGTTLHTELQQHRRRAARIHDIEALHEQVECGRYLHGDDSVPPTTLRTLEQRYRQIWEQRERLLATIEPPLSLEVEEMLRRDLLDVAVFWADCRVRLAAPAEAGDARREGLLILDVAESLFGSRAVITWERRTLAPSLARETDCPPPRTAWEHYTVGRGMLCAGEFDGAAAAFNRAIELRPQDFWPWFGKGVCAQRQKRFEEAVNAFTVCIALAPDNAPCYYNRGLALAARSNAAAAIRDYDRALHLDPHFAAAALNRGVLHLQQNDFTLAENDFQRALECGANPAAVYYNRALLHQARQEPAAALESAEHALQLDPTNVLARELSAQLRKQPLPILPASK